MIVYAIFKEAVYRHECGGIFSTVDAAERAAEAILAREDGHHDVMVVPFELNTPLPAVLPEYPYDYVGVNEERAILRFWKEKVSRTGRATDPAVHREEL